VNVVVITATHAKTIFDESFIPRSDEFWKQFRSKVCREETAGGGVAC
jgi:hypothetical protein